MAWHLALIVAYLAAGVAVTWPRATYLVSGKLPATRDTEQYVWGFWWIAHQTVHLGNPFFTRFMAAPVGVQLGFHTLMPLLGLLLTPVTLAFGPSASLTLLTIVTPGLLCYAMYRAARLWLDSEIAAIAAGAFFGLATMITFQDWYHINIAIGAVALPMTLEAAIRLRRRPCIKYGVILGLVLGASFLVNQESTVMAAILAAGALVPWLARGPLATRLPPLGAGRPGGRRSGQPAADRHGPAGRGRRLKHRPDAAHPHLRGFRRRADRAVRTVTPGRRVRAARPGHRL